LKDFKFAAGRSGQRLRHRKGRQRRSAHGHDVHPGRPVRTRIFASQAGGGGGGGGGGQGNDPAQISQREKEIIPPPSNNRETKNATQQQADAIAKLLAQSQAVAGSGGHAFGRLQARELTDEVQAISDFQKDMIAASNP